MNRRNVGKRKRGRVQKKSAHDVHKVLVMFSNIKADRMLRKLYLRRIINGVILRVLAYCRKLYGFM